MTCSPGAPRGDGDVRDFTPFAEANTAEDTVARLNALFDMVVPAVVDAGGHVNKFLGDGALAVFAAPNDLANHADAAVRAAASIHRLVAQRFGGELRIGTGINTGVVIAGTIGGAGKLEFTRIGDIVNIAARVERLTKTIGDAILSLARPLKPWLLDRPTSPTGGVTRWRVNLRQFRSSASTPGPTRCRPDLSHTQFFPRAAMSFAQRQRRRCAIRQAHLLVGERAVFEFKP
jgi:hypothetical protein